MVAKKGGIIMTRKSLLIFFGVLFSGVMVLDAQAQKPYKYDETVAVVEDSLSNGCTTLQSGLILYSEGHYLASQPILPGYDIFGYNYQAHMFNGSYFNSYAGGAGLPPYEGDDEAYLVANPTAADHWAWPYRNAQIVMKWNDAWLSNKDCDGDGKLDRHFGFPSYIGSGAWETNHQKGEDDGCKWEYFVKIVAVSSDAVNVDGIWYNADGTGIGPDNWGGFATIQEVYNDPCNGYHGILYKSPAGPGFGLYD